MQQQARVAPRNIQFKDDIQVREIPNRATDDLESSRRESWNPNLSEVSDFLLSENNLSVPLRAKRKSSMQSQRNSET